MRAREAEDETTAGGGNSGCCLCAELGAAGCGGGGGGAVHGRAGTLHWAWCSAIHPLSIAAAASAVSGGRAEGRRSAATVCSSLSLSRRVKPAVRRSMAEDDCSHSSSRCRDTREEGDTAGRAVEEEAAEAEEAGEEAEAKRDMQPAVHWTFDDAQLQHGNESHSVMQRLTSSQLS